MFAAGHGKLKSVKILLELGADPDIKDCLGNTAADYAKDFGFPDIEEYLRKYSQDFKLKTSNPVENK
jgi:ankyrin repeat protein